jgi:hypothetical protein
MGKKSLLKKLHQGGNGRFLTHELELRGLDYEISNQEVADAEAKDLLTSRFRWRLQCNQARINQARRCKNVGLQRNHTKITW